MKSWVATQLESVKEKVVIQETIFLTLQSDQRHLTYGTKKLNITKFFWYPNWLYIVNLISQPKTLNIVVTC